MAISDKLQELLDIKQDIKTAIENKGSVLTDVEFDGYAGKIDAIETGGGGGLTGGYNVVYRSDYLAKVPSWISFHLTFVDDTTASYEIKIGGNFPSDWEEQTGSPIDSIDSVSMDGPYVWNNVKSVSITVYTVGSGVPYLEINDVNVGSTYNATLDSNILVNNMGGGPF